MKGELAERDDDRNEEEDGNRFGRADEDDEDHYHLLGEEAAVRRRTVRLADPDGRVNETVLEILTGSGKVYLFKFIE